MKAQPTITLKQIIVLLVIIFLSYGCALICCPGPASISYLMEEEYEARNGLLYEKNSEVPFTGRAITRYKNGQKEFELTYKDGKPDGPHTRWYKSGQKMWEVTYKDGAFVDEYIWDEAGNRSKR